MGHYSSSVYRTITSYAENTQLWLVSHSLVKLRKPASDRLGVKTRTSKLLVENVSEHLFDFKARRSVKDAEYLNSRRNTVHCYSVVAEKLGRCGGSSIHPCIWEVGAGGSLESRSCELSWYAG